LLLFGGTQDDRRAWAEEASEQFVGEGPLQILTSANDLPHFLGSTRGVVFVPDVAVLTWTDQAQLVQCLLRQEERAKWVLGLTANPQKAVEEGLLRPDLWYRLRVAQVDASAPEVQTLLKQRRSRPKPAAPAKAAPNPRGKPISPKRARR
jgi:hypothetical protein